jgi:sugar (glycoside-pentoside-hexuronide) transporter
MGATGAEGQDHVLPTRTKAVYGLGDLSVNLALASMLFIYPNFLTDVAGLAPALAGFVPLVGRFFDALSDPLMGRLSDRTKLRAGRRRPYFLIGMLPFGILYAALWSNPGTSSETASFVYYAAIYALFSLAMTVVSVPYLALIPEMSPSYQERTSINTYRAVAAIVGALLAATALRPLALALGGGPDGFARAGLAAGIFIVLPWTFVFLVTAERPSFRRDTQQGFLEALKAVAKHPAYVRLTGLYLLGRIAIDLTSSMFIFYFTYYLGRPEDFGLTMLVFLSAVAFSLPGWLAISRRVDKRAIFLMGAASWIGSQAFLFLATPEWPRFWIFLGAAIGGVGYAAADMIPWSMLGEVVDEDELRSGERREGIYFGLFTFLRKLGGASAVALGFWALGFSGYVANEAQSAETVMTIRVLTAVVPGLFVALAGVVAFGYPIGRARHAEILAALSERRAEAEASADA